MKCCSFIMLCALFLTVNTAFAEGLPANPWAAKQEVIDGTVLHVSRDELVRSEPVQHNNTGRNDMQELKDIAASVKEKWQQNSQTQPQEQSYNNNNNSVSTIDAVQALDTLSRYMNKNNTQNSKVAPTYSESSTDFSALKQKFSGFTAQSQAKASAANSEAQQKINKLKYEYNHYKSQLNSNYNSFKNKAQPMIDTMKKSVREAEKATGVNF